MAALWVDNFFVDVRQDGCGGATLAARNARGAIDWNAKLCNAPFDGCASHLDRQWRVCVTMGSWPWPLAKRESCVGQKGHRAACGGIESFVAAGHRVSTVIPIVEAHRRC